MPDFRIYAGDTDKTVYVRLRDSTTGLAKVGLLYNSAGAVCSYVLPGAARVAITLASVAVAGAHTPGGFVEVDATNCKGLYRLDLPDAAIASGDFTIISIEFDGIIEESLEIPLAVPEVDVVSMNANSSIVAILVKSLGAIYDGAATSTGTLTTLIDSGLPVIDNYYNGRSVLFITGALAKQATEITDYDQATDTLTIVGVTSAPQVNDQFLII